jgi:hypothetical protein
MMPIISFSQKKKGMLRDTTDQALDLSHYLYNLNGFLPVISPITEPAVGYGGALAGLVFLPKKDTARKGFKMPDVVGVAGGYTENKTWFAGAGYAGFWKADRIRYRGIIGYGDLNLKFYRNSLITGKELSSRFALNSFFLLQQALFRLGQSHFLMGGKYQLSKNEVILFEDIELPGIQPSDFNLINSGIGIITEYDNLNNLFSPTKGLRMNITYDQYLGFLGSDRDYGKLQVFTLYYQPVIKGRWVSGFRLESNMITGDAPFYSLPFISLRGVPAMRYQGDLTALVETEQEIIFSRRWSLVGFGGFGKTFQFNEKIEENNTAWNAGGGFRYLIARVFGLKMGMDVARGPEDWAVYVVVGSSWQK